MKKKLCYFLAAILGVAASCSNVEESTSKPAPEKNILPKTISYKIGTYEYKDGVMVNTGSFDQTNSFVYNGNKIVSVSCPYDTGVMKTVFKYTGNLITKTESYTSNQLSGKTLYNYENDKLQSMTFMSVSDNAASVISKFVYTHNTDGTISYQTYRLGSNIPEDGTVILTFKNGNLIKKVFKYNVKPFYDYSYEYKYDDKNNPLKNILGLDLIAFEGSLNFGHDMRHGEFGITDFGSNNMIEKISVVVPQESSALFFNENVTYTYNTNVYPLDKKSSLEEEDYVKFAY